MLSSFMVVRQQRRPSLPSMSGLTRSPSKPLAGVVAQQVSAAKYSPSYLELEPGQVVVPNAHRVRLCSTSPTTCFSGSSIAGGQAGDAGAEQCDAAKE
jgi:hypothetical protein